MHQAISFPQVAKRRKCGFGIVSTALLIAVMAVSAISPASGEEVYKIGGDVKPPKLVHKEEPKYTKRAEKQRLHGMVVIAAIINSRGIIENVQITKGVDPDLDAEAVKAVSKWRFRPAEKKGKPVAVRVRIEVNFRAPW